MSIQNLAVPLQSHISAIILNWNAAQDTIRCVQAIYGWSHLKADIWVVDNASTDDSVGAIKRACPGIHLVQNATNLGFGGGNNRGLERALACSDTPVLLLNNDATIAEQDVIQLLDTLENTPRLGCVGPLLFDRAHPDRLLSAGGRDISRHIQTHVTQIGSGPLLPVDYVPGTAILIRAEVLRQVGLLDETYFFSGEIADLCERMPQKGYMCAIDARARAFHERHTELDRTEALRTYYSVRNRFLFIKKFRSVFWAALWATYATMMSVSAAMKRERLRARAICLAIVDGIRGRFGDQNERVLSLTLGGGI